MPARTPGRVAHERTARGSEAPRASGRLRLLRGQAIGIVGLGLIGGSLLKALSRFRPDLDLLGHDRDAALAPRARRYGRWFVTLAPLVDASDVIVLAVPADAAVTLLGVIARRVPRRTRPGRLLVCDTGTIKAPLVDAARAWRTRYDFVGLHPMAGAELNGWKQSDPALFAGATCIVCPGPAGAEARARELVRLAGARPLAMDAVEHDRVIAATIGVPHALAFAAAGNLDRAARHPVLRGKSWASLTRVSVSDTGMVAGFLHGNAAHQLGAVADLRKALQRVERALRAPSKRPLERLLARWQSRRR